MDGNEHPDWEQIAELRPHLHWHMQIFPQVYRGDRWYVLYDSASATHLRFNEAAYAFIGKFDGELTVEENWLGIGSRLGDAAPTQAEVVMILAQLFSISALKGGISVNTKEFLARYQASHRLRKKLNPLAVRFPLFDPKLVPGDAFTRHITLRATHVTAMMLQPVISSSIPGLPAYEDEPQLRNTSNRGEASAERRQSITYVVEQAGQVTR